MPWSSLPIKLDRARRQALDALTEPDTANEKAAAILGSWESCSSLVTVHQGDSIRWECDSFTV